jgi:hypothetical protein
MSDVRETAVARQRNIAPAPDGARRCPSTARRRTKPRRCNR